MFAILLIALCVMTAHAQYYSRHFSCPPDNDAVRQFQMMAGDFSPQEIPTEVQAKRDLDNAPEEIQTLARESLSDTLFYKKLFQMPIRPSFSYCCEKPDFRCASEKIPMRFVWYNYNYYSKQFCFVIYPAGEKAMHYIKCTCMTCVRDSYCPVIGRCVESNYTYHYAIVYCPKFNHGYRYKILLVAVPNDCQCMTYCPHSYYGYGYKQNVLASAGRSASAQESAAPQAPMRARPGSEDEVEGLPESP